MADFLRMGLDQPSVFEIIARVVGAPSNFEKVAEESLALTFQKSNPCAWVLQSPNKIVVRFATRLYDADLVAFRGELKRRIEAGNPLLLQVDSSAESNYLKFMLEPASFQVSQSNEWTGWSPYVGRFLGFAPREKERRGTPATAASNRMAAFPSGAPLDSPIDSLDVRSETEILNAQFLAVKDGASAETLSNYMKSFNWLAAWARSVEGSDPVASDRMKLFLRGKLVEIDADDFPAYAWNDESMQNLFVTFDDHRIWVEAGWPQ